MSKNEIPDIDELLNSFLDGELDARHKTEVQRLLQHDKRIAERLQTLRKCKMLVSSLPYIEAPDGMLENIKISLSHKKTEPEEKKTLNTLVPPMQRHREREGVRYLLLRRLTAAAAMIALVGVLAAVIYSIVVPEVTIDMPLAVDKSAVSPPRVVATAEKSVESVLEVVKFTGRLELKTTSPSEVAAFLKKAIEYNISSGERHAVLPDMLKEAHVLACNRQNLISLMNELGTIWNKIDSAKLFINTDKPQGQIMVDAVTPEQIVEIAKQKDFQSQIKTAKFFSTINSITEHSLGKEVMVAIDYSTPDLPTIPKPVLTSSEKPVTKAASGSESEQKVLLTIVVTR